MKREEIDDVKICFHCYNDSDADAVSADVIVSSMIKTTMRFSPCCIHN